MSAPNGLHGAVRLFEALEPIVDDRGADGVEIAYEGGVRQLLRFAGSNVHQGIADRSARVTVRVHLGRRLGQSTAGALEPAALRAALARATAAARATPEDPHLAGFPSPRPLRTISAAFDEETALLDVGEKAERLAACFTRAGQAQATLSGRFHTIADELAVISSRGVRAYHAGTRADVAFFADRSGVGGYAGHLARAAGGIDLGALAERSVRTASAAAKPLPLAPGAYDVVLEPAAVAEVLEWLALVCLTARSVEDGSSFAADGFGRRVTGPRVDLWDEGASAAPDAIPLPFDLEGMPKARLDLLREGAVLAVAHDTRTASRAGVASTGHATEDLSTGERMASPTHLFFGAGETPAAELVPQVERGVYVTRFHYVCGTLDPRRASMTGMTRDGTFLIEDGRITHPVGNLRWTESLLAGFERIAAVSRERAAVPGFWGRSVAVTPHLLVRGWGFTGRQEER